MYFFLDWCKNKIDLILVYLILVIWYCSIRFNEWLFNYDCMNSVLKNDLMVVEFYILFFNESWKLNKCNWNKVIIWYYCKFEWWLNGICRIVEVCWIVIEIWWNGNWIIFEIWLNGKWNMIKIWLKLMVICIWLKFD